MRKFAMITGLTLLAGVAFPQEPSATVTRIVRVRYANPGTLHNLLQDAPGVQMRDDSNMKVIIVRGGAAQVAAVEQSIHDLDVPSTETRSKNVQVIVSVINGSNDTNAVAAGPISEDLAPVVRQLPAIFPYKNYQAVGSMLLRSREGARTENQGVMRSIGGTASSSGPVTYLIQYENTSVASEAGQAVIHLQKLEFFTRIPLLTGVPDSKSWQQFEIAIKTDVDLQEGKKVVVGKANVESSDSAMFVVLTARLVD